MYNTGFCSGEDTIFHHRTILSQMCTIQTGEEYEAHSRTYSYAPDSLLVFASSLITGSLWM